MKPQITQISQMAEARELSAEDRKISGTKKVVAETLALPPIIYVICGICGLSLISVFGLEPRQAG
jgi:hypothetical protein